jgi:RND family efflux transporter MFP subunit
MTLLNHVWAKMRRPWGVALTVMIGLVTIAALVLRAGRGPGDALVETVKRGDVVVTLTEAGVLRPAESMTYRSPLVGRETEITFLTPEGTYVKEGDLLIRLDTSGLTQELERAIEIARQADVDVKAAEADREDAAAAVESATEGAGALDVEEANAKLRLAERNAARLRTAYEGLKPLLDRGFITKEELERASFEADQADTDLSLLRKRVALLTSKTRPRDEQRARVQVEQRDAQVANARQHAKEAAAQVESLRAAINGCTIYASHAGLVVHEEFLGANPRRRVRVGDRVSSTLGLITIPEVERMWLDTSVREADLWRVKAGQTVNVAVDAFPAMRLGGHVIAIGTLGRSAAERPFDEKRFGVTVAIDGANRDLRPDMTARATIAVADRRQVLTIPVSALTKDADAWVVMVVRGWSTERRRVTVGENNGFDVEILDGLKEGERVSLVAGSAGGATASPK